MNKIYTIFIVIILTFFFIGSGFSAQNELLDKRGSSHGLSLLNYGVGTRALSMGGSFVALSDDASSIFHNPAGLTRLKSSFIYMNGQILPDEMYQGALSYTNDRGRNGLWAWGLGARYLTKEPVSKRSIDDTGAMIVDGSIQPNVGAMYFSLAKTDPTETFVWGVNLKGLYNSVDDTSYGGGADVGILFKQFGVFGVVLQDAVTLISSPQRDKLVSLDRILKIGGAFQIGNKEKNPFSLTAQANTNMSTGNVTWHLGATTRIWSSLSEKKKILKAVKNPNKNKDDIKLENFATPKLEEEKEFEDELYINVGINDGAFTAGLTFLVFGMGIDYGIELPSGFKTSPTHSFSLNFFL